MSNLKKLTIAALAVIFLAGATPLAADLDGIWGGCGEGSYETPTGIIIYPWQSWNGTVENGVFSGSWGDDEGNSGGFTGGIIFFYTPNPPTYTFAHCEGTWTWADPEGQTPIEMGPFSMEFNLGLEICEGEWSSCANSEFGTMWGWRIGD